jgi:hypothetical protein
MAAPMHARIKPSLPLQLSRSINQFSLGRYENNLPGDKVCLVSKAHNHGSTIRVVPQQPQQFIGRHRAQGIDAGQDVCSLPELSIARHRRSWQKYFPE